MTEPSKFPRYMGRILTSGGSPQGTCFQIDPGGYLVTAWHVVQGTVQAEGVPLETTEVTVDSLGDGDVKPVRAWLLARDIPADLALLKTNTPLPDSARLLRASESAEQGEKVTLVGHAVIEERGDVPPPRSVQALGSWQGETDRGNGLRMARIFSRDVVPGMSGAPVRRLRDDTVLGVLSSRHHSSDQSMVNSVWVSRTEDLLRLCEGHVPVREGRWLGVASAGAAGTAAGYALAEYAHRGDGVLPEASEALAGAASAAPVPEVSGLADAVTDEVVAQASEGVVKKAVKTIVDLFW